MRALTQASTVILLLSVLAIAGGKPGIVWDAGAVTGRDVYSARGNGKKIRLRTGRDDEDATFLTVSPDGRRMAWWLIPPGLSGRRDLVVARTAGGRGRNVTAEMDGKVVIAKFTGDSKHLLFVFEEADTERVDLWRVNVRGKGLRNLTREVPGHSTGTLRVSPFGAEALVSWEFTDRAGLVLVDVKRGLPSILNPGLPDGEPGDYASWPEAGVLHFTWREDGAEKNDLWQLDETEIRRRVSANDTARAVGGGTVLFEGSELLLVTAIADRRWEAPEEILHLGRGFEGLDAIVAVAGDPGPRVLLLRSHEAMPPIDLLDGHELEEVEEVRALPDGLTHVAAVVEAGARQLYLLRPGTAPLDPAKDLTGRIGAFRTILPDGTLIFATVAEHSSTGELHAWKEGDRTALIARTGLVGLPGRAVFSEKTCDVLFNVIAMPEADNRVFLWDRKRDEVRALTPEYQRPGTFLFTR